MQRPPLIDISLSDHTYESKHCGVQSESNFHDLRFTDDLVGGNKNEITFTIENVAGNYLELDVWEGRGENYKIIDVEKVRIKIKGAWEKDEFLRMLQHILDAEKIGPTIFRGET
jgi:hypothetical protein